MKGGKQKRYWSGIKNLHKRLTLNNKEGREARKEFYQRTHYKYLLEKNFEKNIEKGKTISLKQARKLFSVAKNQRDKQLRKDWLESKKAGNKESFREFKRANPEPDWDLIQEMFNSPK